MKIYFAHSRSYDYANELYKPIRACKDLNQAEIILPHETSTASNNTRDFYKTLDLIIAEVSYPATGLGIELGWAYDDETPIICIAKVGAKVSGSIMAVTDKVYFYENTEEMLEIIKSKILDYNKKVI